MQNSEYDKKGNNFIFSIVLYRKLLQVKLVYRSDVPSLPLFLDHPVSKSIQLKPQISSNIFFILFHSYEFQNAFVIIIVIINSSFIFSFCDFSLVNVIFVVWLLHNMYTRRHLARNPFICDCNLRWLADYLHKNPIETSGARCDAPKRMHRRRIEALRDEKFKCKCR